ncbi:Colanic acid biosynthesis glycosyl transferase WcaC [Salmonella enterica subsp. enterica serovar Johannesburg str. S5-703]|nr:Colanic acid biosynthesis glycosyl transferase WcaC [Salmonella enterica subsp. enterica serovar Johannesburg str. S5-703]
MDALVFSSRVDNYPLILCEALSIGVPVLATHSEAAQEVLAKSGGQTFAATDVLRLRLAQRRKPEIERLAQRRKPEIAQAVFGATLDAFRMRSRVAYSGQQMLEEYVSFYQNL